LFISENSNFDEYSFNTLLKSIEERKKLTFELEKSLKTDNLEDRNFESEEVAKAYDEFMTKENKSYNDLLSLQRDVRIKLCTK